MEVLDLVGEWLRLLLHVFDGQPCATEAARGAIIKGGFSRFRLRLGRFVLLVVALLVALVGLVLVVMPLLADLAHWKMRGSWYPWGAVIGVAMWLLAVLLYVDGGFNLRRRMAWRFRQACLHVGLVAVRPGRKAGETVTLYPKLVDIVGNKAGWSAEVAVIPGQGFRDFEKHIEAFSLAFQASGVRFVLHRGGRAAVYVVESGAMLPVVEHPYDEAAIAANNAQAAMALLAACPLGYQAGGGEFRVPILGSHLLIAGRTGAGKGSYIWSLVLGLAPAAAQGYVKLWGFDPKRVELAIARDWWDRYAYADSEMVELLEDGVRDMQHRAEWMQGRARKFTPSIEVPLNILVIDELAYLSNLMTDKKLRERADKALCLLLTQGRALGYAVVGALQDPRKETLGYRDLFPLRVALSLPADMVDLVLGKGAREAGACCDLIPIGEAGAGLGFMMAEHSPLPVRVRARWCSDEVVQMYASLVMRAREWPRLRDMTTGALDIADRDTQSMEVVKPHEEVA